MDDDSDRQEFKRSRDDVEDLAQSYPDDCDPPWHKSPHRRYQQDYIVDRLNREIDP